MKNDNGIETNLEPSAEYTNTVDLIINGTSKFDLGRLSGLLIGYSVVYGVPLLMLYQIYLAWKNCGNA